jgi:hypothetical protein
MRLALPLAAAAFLLLAKPEQTAAPALRPPPPAAHHQHHRVRWQLYLREHHATTRLGRKVRTLRSRLRALQQELERARRVHAVAPVDWRTRQIAAAETIARESSGDPWPNCPDPYDGSGASWGDTVNCENSGDWLDTPGYYRCGLQFDPMWERRFGRLCP